MKVAGESGESSAVARILLRLNQDRAVRARCTVVAIDGRSGAGKSTLAAALAAATEAIVIDGDDFFAGGVDLARDDPAARAARCIDWRRQREVLVHLREGRPATYRAFDWDKFDGRWRAETTRVDPAPIVILEGVYAGRLELRDLLDVRVLLLVPDEIRSERLLAREGAIGPWERQWHEAEDWYFQHAATQEGFDLVIANV